VPHTREPIRRTVLFSGRVQGVGFRFTTESIARRFSVTGFVRNLDDGRVELVAEGPADQVELFVGSVRETMHRYITHSDETDTPGTEAFKAFRIVH